MKIVEIIAVAFGLLLGITALSAGQGLVGCLFLVMAVFLLFFGEERKGPVYLRPWVKKCFRKKPVDTAERVPENHTAQQPAPEPIPQKNRVSHTLSQSMESFQYKENDFTYQCRPDGTAEVTHCHGWHSEKEIPETVSGYRVTSIGENAFPNGNCLSLSIPASVTEIKSLPEGFYEQRWDRPRFDMRENAMDIDEPVLVTNYYHVKIIVKPGSFAEQYCKNNNIRYVVK